MNENKKKKIVIGSDLAAYTFKKELIKELKKSNICVDDAGSHSSLEGDYPIYANTICKKIISNDYDKGILICGTGQGMCMAANKLSGIRAALCLTIPSAILSREHNDSNVLCLGAWFLSVKKAVKIIEVWLFCKFSKGEKHIERINYMNEMHKNI